jgi:hypothetical protein
MCTYMYLFRFSRNGVIIQLKLKTDFMRQKINILPDKYTGILVIFYARSFFVPKVFHVCVSFPIHECVCQIAH